MKLKENASWGDKRVFSITDAVSRECDGSDYGQGAVEDAKRTADKTAELLGRLITTLHERGRITDDDLLAVFYGKYDAVPD